MGRSNVNIFHSFRTDFLAAVEALIDDGRLPSGLDLSFIGVEPPKEAAHGDITTNAAMVLANPAGMKPRDVAELLIGELVAFNDVETVEIAGPGFINICLADECWRACLVDVLKAGTGYGDSAVGGGELVNVEYVSANPTGPLHVAHARGAVVGDALARLLAKAGYEVATEYYINDAGAQVETLARSTYLRYREALGDEIGEIPEGFYPGEYLKPVGAALAERDGEKWMNAEEVVWLDDIREFVVARMMVDVRKDLSALGIEQAVFASERALVDAGSVKLVLEILESRDLVYTGVLESPKGNPQVDWEPRSQLLFKATEFGDDVDRPLKKSDGAWTYFANDIAYHLDKYNRGFKKMIDVWGADHGGYVKRMRAAVSAVTAGDGELDIKLCQIVHLRKGGEPLKMSKRAGNFVTLRYLIDEVGKDVVRFTMLTRKNDSQMEFDLEKALEQSRDNPVFYVQYAHARCCSVLRNALNDFTAAEIAPGALADSNLARLDDQTEMDLIRLMAAWPRMIEGAAVAHEPHRIAYYLNDLATLFHALWNMGKDEARLRFICSDDRELTLARLALVQGIATVIASGLQVFGVMPVEELR